MFERNDKALIKIRILLLVGHFLLAISALALGIALAVIKEEGLYLLLVPFAWLLLWRWWLSIRLHLSYLCDIKLIRNKLYGENSDGLADFLKSTKEQIAELDEKERIAEEIEAKLAHYYQLMERGIITKEEYKKREKELLEKEKGLNGTDKKE